MKTNIKEELLMAYLYGELSTEEKREVEKQLDASREDQNKLQEMQFIKTALSKVNDKEVIAPPVFMDDSLPKSSSSPFGGRGVNFIRYSIGIAAAFFIVMVGAKLLGLQMQYSNEGLMIGFGDVNRTQQAANLSSEQVQQMINASLSKNNDLVNASWGQSQSKINQALKQNVFLTSQKINEANKNSLSATQEEIRQFMESMRSQNTQALQDYIRLSGNDQKQYIENLLVDFSKYQQEQRNQDLNLMNTRLTTLEQDNNLFREEAGQILTSLISNENNSSVKRN